MNAPNASTHTTTPAAISSAVETITPEIAQAMLATTRRNRGLSKATVRRYTADMRRGHWLINSDAIAFDDTGALTNGQHRLSAVIASGATIQALIVRGLGAIDIRGLSITAQDVTDCGKRRSIGDQMQISHDVEHGRHVAAAVNAIALLCGGSAVSAPQALEIHALYREPITEVLALSLAAIDRQIAFASLIGAGAYLLAARPAEARSYLERVFTRVGITPGDPAQAAVADILKIEPAPGSGWKKALIKALTKGFALVLGRPNRPQKYTAWLHSLDPARVCAVREILCLDAA